MRKLRSRRWSTCPTWWGWKEAELGFNPGSLVLQPSLLTTTLLETQQMTKEPLNVCRTWCHFPQSYLWQMSLEKMELTMWPETSRRKHSLYGSGKCSASLETEEMYIASQRESFFPTYLIGYNVKSRRVSWATWSGKQDLEVWKDTG